MTTFFWLASFSDGAGWSASGNKPIDARAKFKTAKAAVEAFLTQLGGADLYRLVMRRGNKEFRVLDVGYNEGKSTGSGMWRVIE